MYIRIIINTPLSIQNNRIYWAIKYSDDKEVESLVNDSKTDVNWTNEASFFVSVILTLIIKMSCFIIFNYNI